MVRRTILQQEIVVEEHVKLSREAIKKRVKLTKAIAWRSFSLDMMALMAAGNDNAPLPTKAHGAL